jgi:hypothetical protein
MKNEDQDFELGLQYCWPDEVMLGDCEVIAREVGET